MKPKDQDPPEADHSHQHDGHAHNHAHPHDHNHESSGGDAEHAHGHHHALSSSLGWALALNITFTLVEVLGAYFTNSVSILADCVHDFGDSMALFLAWGMQRWAARTRDDLFSYGYTRLSLLSAVVNSVLLLVGSVITFGWGVHRIINPEPVLAPGMFALSILGIAMNGVAAWRLHKGQSLNEQMAYWHLLEDALGWVAVFIGSIAIWLWDINGLDAVLCIFISCFVAWQVLRRFKEILRVFLQAVPEGLTLSLVREQLLALPEVQDVHHVQLWSLDGAIHVGTAHVVVASNFSKHKMIELKKSAKERLLKLRVHWLTLEFEFQDEDCIEAPNPNSN